MSERERITPIDNRRRLSRCRRGRGLIEAHTFFKDFCLLNHLDSLDDERFMRKHRADTFAGAAADADLGMDMRDIEMLIHVVGEHFNGGYRAMLSAG